MSYSSSTTSPSRRVSSQKRKRRQSADPEQSGEDPVSRYPVRWQTAKMVEKGEAIRQLAYHPYTLCEREKCADEARAYSRLISSWHAIVTAFHEATHTNEQVDLDF